MNKKLILILILAAFLRFWQLGSVPALNADEAALGYNAYSLIETGKDEHGNPWPIHFQSFNDYKPGLYVYLILPFVKFFGLNPLAIRIPGAFLGVATVYLIYLLVRELFNDERLAIISSLLLAISPWHIHFSRGAWEVNVATFFMTAGLLLFIKGLKDQKYFVYSVLSFVLSLYTYHATRVVVPLLGLGLFVIYSSELIKNVKPLIRAGVIGTILIIPLVLSLVRGGVLSRAAGVGLFADPGPLSRLEEQRSQHVDFTSLPAKLMHNKGVNYFLAFAENLMEHYSGDFLFISGDEIQRNRVPETGQAHIYSLLFILVGIWWIVKRPSKEIFVVLLWLLVAPTAAALTFQSPHALRAQNMVIPLTILSAFGLVKILNWLAKQENKKLVTTGYWSLVILISWAFARYQHMYWVHMVKEYPFSSQYGFEEMFNYVEENKHKFEKVVITDRYDQPYILSLFHLKYPPSKFQNEHQLTPRDTFGFSTVRTYNMYNFVSIRSWDQVRTEYPRSLIIGTNKEIPREANVIKIIYFPNGEIAYKIAAN